MKKKLFILLTLLPMLAWAGKNTKAGIHPGFGDGKYNLSSSIGYEHNISYGHSATLNVKSLLPVNPYVELEARVQLSTANLYTLAGTVRPKFPLPVGELFFQTDFLYRNIARSRMEDLALGISLGYRMDYISIQVGTFGRVMRPFNIPQHSNEYYNVEPFNLLYRMQIYCRPQSNRWNIWACISNMEDYQIERAWQLLFMLGAHYDVTSHWRIILDTYCKPAGMFHLNAEYFGAYVRAGFTYRF